MPLKNYTVIAINRDSGQIISHHVSAISSGEAFVIVSKISDLDLVAAIDGWITEGKGIEFPGSATVDSDTVLAQPEVFGGQSVCDFYMDDEYTPDSYWISLVSEGATVLTPENEGKAEQLYMRVGGRKAAQSSGNKGMGK